MIVPETLSGITLGEVQRRTLPDAFECRLLLCHVLRLSRAQLIAQSERVLTPGESQQLADVFNRRLAGEPIAYITGTREFYGLEFHVTPDVLIPRPETELLVELALARLPPGGSVLDMGTGSGAIAIAIAHARPDTSVTALDASAAALRVAQGNAERLLAKIANEDAKKGANIRFLESNWYEALSAQERFDVIVANPPYIAAGDVHLVQGDLRFEPADALTDHSDGLSALRAITAGASRFLKTGGCLFMEHGYDQATQVQNLLISNRFASVQSWQDLAGHQRVSGGECRG